MHPFALYLVAKDVQQDYRAAAERTRRTRFARVAAVRLNEPAPGSRLGRLTALLRRRVARSASA